MLFLVSLVVFGPKSFGRRGKWQSPPVTRAPESSKIWWGHNLPTPYHMVNVFVRHWWGPVPKSPYIPTPLVKYETFLRVRFPAGRMSAA